MKHCRTALSAAAALWLACVPLPMGEDGGDAMDPSAERPKPAWPAPESRCVRDEQCRTGLVCEPLDAETLEEYFTTIPRDEVPPETPLREGQGVCRPGCRIDDVFYAADQRNLPDEECLSCRPALSTTDWSPVVLGAACDDGLACTSGGGLPGGADSCDGAGACRGEAVNCDDGLFCTGVESCNEETGQCDSSGDPCPDTECNTCQEDGDTCFDSAGTLCGDDKNTKCDDADTCDGSGACLTNFAPPTKRCRDVAGICDVPETCNGRGRCREDKFKPHGTVCNAGSGDLCDPDEVCTGASAACPEDTFASATTVCNPGTGDICDPDEFCSGNADEACPTDMIAEAGTVCNPGTGDICDPDEVCSGNADEVCPRDSVAAAGTVCRVSADACDAEEVCTGVADQRCAADAKQPEGFECRPSAGDCDVAETCDGVNDACPGDEKQASTFECRASSFPCDEPEVCDGINNDCPADDPPCEDGAVCDADEQCQSGACIGGTCGPAAAINGVCDSDPDCQAKLICDGQVCKVGRDGACPEANDCAGGLTCDDASSTCKVASGGTCVASSDCANGSTCDGDPATCRSGMNGACYRSEDCSSGLICACDNFKTFVCPPDCEEDRCGTEGICKVPASGTCANDSDCGIQRSIDLGEVLYCPSGTCEYKLPVGAVCQVDPPGEICDPGCVLPPSPNDDTCLSGTCFLTSGTAPPYTDPPDFICCSELGDPCIVNEDCCLEPRRRQHVCSNSVCVRVAIAGEPCETTSDCHEWHCRCFRAVMASSFRLERAGVSRGRSVFFGGWRY